MKRLISILLTILMVGSCSFSVSAAKTKKAATKEAAVGNEHTPWFRVVKQDQLEYNCKVKGDSTRSVKVFAGELVRVQGQFNGNIILGQDTLDTDGSGCTDYAAKDTFEHVHRQLPINVWAVIDTIYITGQQSDTINYMVIDHVKGKLLKEFIGKDTLALNTEVDSATVLRIAPADHVATFFNVGEIQGYGVVPVVDIPEPEKSKAWILWLVIGVAVLILLGVGFFVWKKMKSRKADKEKIEPTENKPSDDKGDGKIADAEKNGPNNPQNPGKPKDKSQKPNNVLKKDKEEQKKSKEESKQPNDESKQPTDESKQPTDESKQPNDESKQSNDESKQSNDESKQSNDESKKPIDEPKKFIDEPETLVYDPQKENPELIKAKAEIEKLTKRAQEAEDKIAAVQAQAKEDVKAAEDKAKQDIEDAKAKAKKDIEEANTKAKKDIEDAKAKAKKDIEDAKVKNQKDIEDTKAKAKQKIEEADKKRQAAEEKTKTISDELEAKFSAERKNLSEKITKLTADLTTTTSTLNSTRSTLTTTETNLTNAKAEISRLEAAMKKYSDVLTYVPFAKEYAAVVARLLDLSGKVQAEADRLLKLDVDDPFHIMKFISRYSRALNAIDMNTLTTEVRMIDNGEMVIKGSVISTYDQSKDKSVLDAATRNYFFTNYLRQLVDALVVFNESLAGTDRLVDGVKRADVQPFADLREEIEKVCRDLDIVVETVHLFDKVGQKTDLNADMIDAGFAPGDIIDIENAIVYLKGSHRPTIKVRVKAQS